MTISEKRGIVIDYCKKTDCSIKPCVLVGHDWRHVMKDIKGGKVCLDLAAANVDELDKAVELINGRENFEFNGCEYCKHSNCHCNVEPCASCKHNKIEDSEEYNNAPEYYEPSIGAVLPVARETEGASKNSKAATVIQLEVKDNSPMQLAYAIRNYIWEYYSPKYEIALIALDEFVEHIDAYVRAERKALEYKKMEEEG